jgi:hypothetical protein
MPIPNVVERPMPTSPARRQPLRAMAIIKVRSARETRTVIAPLAREEKTGGPPSFLSSTSNLSNNAIRMRKDPNQVSPQVGVSLHYAPFWEKPPYFNTEAETGNREIDFAVDIRVDANPRATHRRCSSGRPDFSAGAGPRAVEYFRLGDVGQDNQNIRLEGHFVQRREGDAIILRQEQIKRLRVSDLCKMQN